MKPSNTALRVVAAVAAGALLAVPAVDAKKKKPKPPQKAGATYQGVTSQGSDKCFFNGDGQAPCSAFALVAKDGKTVTQQIYFTAPCDNGENVYRSSTVFKKLPIKKKGKYGLQASYQSPVGDAMASNAVTLHAQFKRKGKSYSDVGTFQIESNLTSSDGSTTHCSSGKVTFTVKPQKKQTQG
jgi:hypothetical protein